MYTSFFATRFARRSWDGTKNLAAHSEASDFVLRQPTEATEDENAIISDGIKAIFQKLKLSSNINVMKIAKQSPTYEATFTKNLPFRAWEVC